MRLLMRAEELLDLLRAWYPRGAIARAAIEPGEEGPTLHLHTARPGILIGPQGRTLQALQARLVERLGPVRVQLYEIRRAELEPLLLADHLLQNLVRGVRREGLLERLCSTSLRAGADRVQLTVTGALALSHEARAEGSEEETDGERREASVEGLLEGGLVRCEARLVLPRSMR